jgi:hypothetical protein
MAKTWDLNLMGDAIRYKNGGLDAIMRPVRPKSAVRMQRYSSCLLLAFLFLTIKPTGVFLAF